MCCSLSAPSRYLANQTRCAAFDFYSRISRKSYLLNWIKFREFKTSVGALANLRNVHQLIFIQLFSISQSSQKYAALLQPSRFPKVFGKPGRCAAFHFYSIFHFKKISSKLNSITSEKKIVAAFLPPRGVWQTCAMCSIWHDCKRWAPTQSQLCIICCMCCTLQYGN